MKSPGGFWALGSVTLVLPSLAVIAALALAACGGSGTTASSSPSAATLPSAAPSESGIPLPTPTVAGTIAFSRTLEQGANADIYVVNTDGTGLKQLTNDPGWEESPSWSPDGSRIAWVINGADDSSVDPAFDYHPTPTVWVMNTDGSGKVQLTTGAVHGAHPTWSPDGKKVAFLRYWPKKEAICVMNADGSGLRQVTPTTSTVLTGYGYEMFKWYVSPTWGSDGKIYYVQVQAGHLFSVNPDGSGRVRLTPFGGSGQKFGLSPGGQRLAVYTFTGDKHMRVVVVPTHGAGKKTTLLDDVSRFDVGDDFASSWAPDGQVLSLATVGSSGGGSQLLIVNADASGLSAVPGIDGAADPAWRPE